MFRTVKCEANKAILLLIQRWKLVDHLILLVNNYTFIRECRCDLVIDALLLNSLVLNSLLL